MKNTKKLLSLILLSLVFSFAAKAQVKKDTDFSFSGQWFLSYQQEDTINRATLKRGYLTFKKKFNKTISARFTQDITLDNEGSDAGNIEMRLKYCYVKINNHYLKFMQHSYFEAGLVHKPWLDYEQKINDYRVQGKMFIERNRILNSADFGITFTNLFGGEMDEEYKKNINKGYPGKYGSMTIGVYNGGGYHATEQNSNKTFEGRLSIRPLPSELPGIQATYNMAYGKGNSTESPDFNTNHYILSYEDKLGVLMAQYHEGEGDASAKYVDTLFNSYENSGYSGFMELKIPKTKVALFGRYDYFELEAESVSKHTRYIGGVCYRFHRNSKVLFDVDYGDKNGKINRIYELAIELRF